MQRWKFKAINVQVSEYFFFHSVFFHHTDLVKETICYCYERSVVRQMPHVLKCSKKFNYSRISGQTLCLQKILHQWLDNMMANSNMQYALCGLI